MGQYNTYGTIEMGLHLSVKPWGFQRDISHILIDYGIYPPVVKLGHGTSTIDDDFPLSIPI